MSHEEHQTPTEASVSKAIYVVLGIREGHDDFQHYRCGYYNYGLQDGKIWAQIDRASRAFDAQDQAWQSRLDRVREETLEECSSEITAAMQCTGLGLHDPDITEDEYETLSGLVDGLASARSVIRSLSKQTQGTSDVIGTKSDHD